MSHRDRSPDAKAMQRLTSISSTFKKSQLGPVDESIFPGLSYFQHHTNKIGNAGLRSTASARHEATVQAIESELKAIPGMTLRSETYDILRWQTVDDVNLDEAASFSITAKNGRNAQEILLGGAIPYSLPTNGNAVSGPLVYVPADQDIAEVDVSGKIVLRDFPKAPIPCAVVYALAHSCTPDLENTEEEMYDRPSQANEPLHADLLDAANAGAVGFISMFDLPQNQIQSYFEPHFGTHYRIPGAFVGVDEALLVKQAASKGGTGTLDVRAEVRTAPTRNVFGTLPGKSMQRVILNCHTDGNTFVQDNGIAALLALAKYFASQPAGARVKTLEFAFTTGHLHISQEGAARYAEQLDREYAEGTIALVIPVEHMGTTEIVPQDRRHGKEGRELAFSGRGELMLWSVGPIEEVIDIVKQAVQKRNLDRTVVTRGASMPDEDAMPPVASFGGIGTYFNLNLLPTTSLISGPWSLWAPSFGPLAIDLTRLRNQTLAIADVIVAVDPEPRDTLAGEYKHYRAKRASGAAWKPYTLPPEKAIPGQRSNTF